MLLTHSKFQQIIKLAAQPVQEAGKRSAQVKNDDYSGKKTHPRKTANASD